jgi:hypothetical protein
MLSDGDFAEVCVAHLSCSRYFRCCHVCTNSTILRLLSFGSVRVVSGTDAGLPGGDFVVRFW